MDISTYISNVIAKITNQKNKGTISGSTIGDALTDLASLTKVAVEQKLDASSASTIFQPIGNYLTAGNFVSANTLNNYYTTGQTDTKYQPVGNYQPSGSYVSASTLSNYYTTGQTDTKYLSAAALNNYYTSGQTDTKYQPVGNYASLGTGSTLPASLLPTLNINGLQFEQDATNGLQLIDSWLMNKINTAIATALNQTQLAAPTLVLGSVTPTSIPLTWNAVTNANNYVLTTSLSANFATGSTIYNGSGSTFTHTGLTAQSAHYYRVTANGNSFQSSNPSNVITGITSATVSGLTPYTNFGINRNVTVSGNSITYSAIVDYGRSVSNTSVAPGATFTFQSNINPASNSGQLGVSIDSIGSPDYQLLGSITYSAADATNGRFWSALSNAGNDTYTNIPVPNGVTLKRRIRGTGTVIYFEYSYDNGVTWTASTNVAQPQTALFLQASFNGTNAVNDTVASITSTL